jgi:hypothetical protein
MFCRYDLLLHFLHVIAAARCCHGIGHPNVLAAFRGVEGTPIGLQQRGLASVLYTSFLARYFSQPFCASTPADLYGPRYFGGGAPTNSIIWVMLSKTLHMEASAQVS